MATTEEFNQSIDVLTIFHNGAVRPVKIKWAGRTHTIHHIAYRWVTRDGSHQVRHYSAALDSGSLCEIELHTHTMRWTLRKVQMDG